MAAALEPRGASPVIRAFSYLGWSAIAIASLQLAGREPAPSSRPRSHWRLESVRVVPCT
jgi:hypothetical protein